MKLQLTDDDGNTGPLVDIPGWAVERAADWDAEKHPHVVQPHAACELSKALAAAMPKPRIHPKPGDLLRLARDRFSYGVAGRCLVPLIDGGCNIPIPDGGLDPDEWQIIPAERIAALFDEERGA